MQPLNSIASIRGETALFQPFDQPCGDTLPRKGSVYPPLYYGDTDVGFLKYLKLRFPLHKETLESWIKILDDVTKAAFIAVLPLIWLNSHSLIERGIAIVVLVLIGYIAQVFTDRLRKYRDSLTGKDSSC